MLVAVGSAPSPSRRPTLWSCRATFYANLLIIERRKCLLVIHAATLFSVFCPDVRAAQLRQFGPFLVPRIIAQLEAEGLSERALGELDGDQVIIAATTGGRSVLGTSSNPCRGAPGPSRRRASRQ